MEAYVVIPGLFSGFFGVGKIVIYGTREDIVSLPFETDPDLNDKIIHEWTFHDVGFYCPSAGSSVGKSIPFILRAFGTL